MRRVWKRSTVLGAWLLVALFAAWQLPGVQRVVQPLLDAHPRLAALLVLAAALCALRHEPLTEVSTKRRRA